ncbi:MAG: ABC transporter substrate-binding protein [Deltaproteobacteria bacterium]|uniref:ABC transporter substrate-binding protein n=1 Tax=Candidatus Zymogenus saltonus TaxID=2844893 RepID=A0A9D8PQL1_9DELT|nr:ABC transporter substrate-binding protein [Candidatus Zymogenus saltonus]
MKLRKILFLGLLLMISAGLLVTSCEKKPPPELTAEPYVIGGVFSVTGSNSFLGEPEKKSMELYADIVNKEGGIDGHPVEVVIYDDEGDPTNSVTLVKKLIEKDNVLAIVGPSLSGNTLSVIDVIEEKEVPLVSCAASIKITDPVKKWVFKTPQTDVMAVQKIYEYFNANGIKKIAIITVSNGYGDSGKEQLKAQAPGAGIEIVAEESFGSEDTDMTTQLTVIKGTDAEAIVCWGTNPGPAIVAKNMVQLDIKTPLFQSHGVASPKFLEIAGDAANGIILPAGKIIVADQLPKSDPQRDVLMNYKEVYEETFPGSKVSSFGGHAWDAMAMITEALKTSGADKAKLRDEIEKTTNYIGIHGIFNMTPEDHTGLNIESAFVMLKIENGNWVIIK